MRTSSKDVEKIGRWARVGGLVAAIVSVGAARARADEPPGDAVERELAAEARLPTILRVVEARNAELRETAARAGAAEARVGAMARMPDLELKGELWGVPLARPLSFRESNTIMLGEKRLNALRAQGQIECDDCQGAYADLPGAWL